MFKSDKSDADTRAKLSDVMSKVILGSNGNINSILSQVSEVLGTDEHNEYIEKMLNNVADLNSTGSSGVIARKDMWEFGRQTLSNYSQRIELNKELSNITPDELEAVNENIKSITQALNNQLISGGEARYILDKIIIKPQTPQTKLGINLPEGVSENSPCVKYYLDNKEKMSKDSTVEVLNSNSIKITAGNSSEVVILDNNGKLVSREEIVEETNQTRSITKYDENGNTTTTNYGYINGELYDKKTVDADGNLLSIEINDNSADWYTFPATGKPNSSVKVTNFDGKILASAEYNAKGKKAETEYITEFYDSTYESKLVYDYDDNGNMISIQRFRWDQDKNEFVKENETTLPEGADPSWPSSRFFMKKNDTIILAAGEPVYTVADKYTLSTTSITNPPVKYIITVDESGEIVSTEQFEEPAEGKYEYTESVTETVQESSDNMEELFLSDAETFG